MQGWDIADFRAAAIVVLKRSEYMPTPKTFEDLRLAGRPTAGEAWGAAVQHAALGRYRQQLLGDPLTDACVAMLGGYRALGQCEEDKLHFLERRFAEHYAAKQDAEDVRQALPQIAARSGWPLLQQTIMLPRAAK